MIDKLIRRAVWTLLVICLASSAGANSYPPNIEASQVVTLDVAAIERSAQSGTPFELVFGDTRLNVVLTPAPVFPEEGLTIVEILKDGSTRETVVPGNFTYAGEVLGGDPAETEVRFTIADGVLEGYVSAKDWWFFEPLARYDPKAASNQYLVYTPRETTFAAEHADGDTSSPGEAVDSPFINDGRIPMCMVADLQFLSQSGGSFQRVMQRQATVINGVNGIYKRQFGRVFRVPLVLLDSGGTLTSTDPATLLEQLKVFAGRKRLAKFGCGMAHLTTGKNINGEVMGRAELPGHRSFSQQSTTLDLQNTLVAAHEIAHNFNSTHADAVQLCIPVPPTCLVYYQTLCAATINQTTVDHFSAANVQKMCLEMGQRGFVCQANAP
jgi:hypothetical protein